MRYPSHRFQNTTVFNSLLHVIRFTLGNSIIFFIYHIGEPTRGLQHLEERKRQLPFTWHSLRIITAKAWFSNSPIEEIFFAIYYIQIIPSLPQTKTFYLSVKTFMEKFHKLVHHHFPTTELQESLVERTSQFPVVCNRRSSRTSIATNTGAAIFEPFLQFLYLRFAHGFISRSPSNQIERNLAPAKLLRIPW